MKLLIIFGFLFHISLGLPGNPWDKFGRDKNGDNADTRVYNHLDHLNWLNYLNYLGCLNCNSAAALAAASYSGQWAPVGNSSESVAVLITGNWGNGQSEAELFLPRSNSSCSLPNLPDKRQGHIQSGNTLCGGEGSSPSSPGRTCLEWQKGDWVQLAFTFSEQRWSSSHWRLKNGSLIIMGGLDAEAQQTSYLLEGNTTQPSFKMKYLTTAACSIPMGDTVVITGGVYSGTTVSVYGRRGWTGDLGPLTFRRFNHGCTSFLSDRGERVLMVTGGHNGYKHVDTTELLYPLSVTWTKVTSAKLHRPLSNVRITNVGNRIFGFGGDSWRFVSKDILEFSTTNRTWTKVGEMKFANCKQNNCLVGTSLVKFEDYKDFATC